MTITSELNTLQTNLSNAYDAIEEKGGTLPANKNMNNLADSIANIPEANYTLMGNELRRACCYSKTENITDACKIYNCYANTFSSAFQASTISAMCLAYCSNGYNGYANYTTWYIIIDGKLYSFSKSLVLSQIGTDSDWEDIASNYCIKNGKLYSSYTNAINNSGGVAVVNPVYLNKSNAWWGSNIYINGGYLYSTAKKNTPAGCSYVSARTSGEYGFLIANNLPYRLNLSSYAANVITYLNVYSKEKFCGGNTSPFCAIANSNQLYYYSFTTNNSSVSSSSSYTYPDTIKKITNTSYSHGSNFSNIFVLLENGDLYKGSTKKLENVKDFLVSSGAYVITNNNEIYDLTSSNPTKKTTISEHIIMKNDTDYYMTVIKMSGNAQHFTHKYTIKPIDEAQYSYISNLVDDLDYKENIDYVDNSILTVNGINYIRDPDNDLVFDFIPEDLENHNYTDAEMLLEFLNAGVKQGNG